MGIYGVLDAFIYLLFKLTSTDIVLTVQLAWKNSFKDITGKSLQ